MRPSYQISIYGAARLSEERELPKKIDPNIDGTKEKVSLCFFPKREQILDSTVDDQHIEANIHSSNCEWRPSWCLHHNDAKDSITDVSQYFSPWRWLCILLVTFPVTTQQGPDWIRFTAPLIPKSMQIATRFHKLVPKQLFVVPNVA